VDSNIKRFLGLFPKAKAAQNPDSFRRSAQNETIVINACVLLSRLLGSIFAPSDDFDVCFVSLER
jgi:hypothetical protein